MEDFNFDMNVVVAGFNDDGNVNNDKVENENDKNDTKEIITDEDIQKRLENNINKSTKMKYQWAVNCFQKWLENEPNKPNKAVSDFSVDDVNYHLPRFIMSCRNSKNEKYRPKTLLELVLCLQQAINHERSKQSLNRFKFLNDNIFSVVRGVLDSEMKLATKEGLNIPNNQVDIITEAQENDLWEKNILGDDTPEKLSDTLLYLVGTNFALRGGQEHADLTLDNFELSVGSNNEKKFIYTRK